MQKSKRKRLIILATILAGFVALLLGDSQSDAAVIKINGSIIAAIQNGIANTKPKEKEKLNKEAYKLVDPLSGNYLEISNIPDNFSITEVDDELSTDLKNQRYELSTDDEDISVTLFESSSITKEYVLNEHQNYLYSFNLDDIDTNISSNTDIDVSWKYIQDKDYSDGQLYLIIEYKSKLLHKQKYFSCFFRTDNKYIRSKDKYEINEDEVNAIDEFLSKVDMKFVLK